jgi:hypothetical protein
MTKAWADPATQRAIDKAENRAKKVLLFIFFMFLLQSVIANIN